MSKASEFAKIVWPMVEKLAMEIPPFAFSVTSDGRLGIGVNVDGKVVTTIATDPATAIRIAHWLIDTFGEPTP